MTHHLLFHNPIFFLKTYFYDEIEEYCQKISNIIKVMSKIKKLKIEQILESRIIIDEFFKAIIAFDNNLINLNKEKVVDFCLMKDKISFLSIFLSFQNNLAAMKNLVTSINS
uniref:Uncharacterized protein n=1 Tax=Sipha flava TaxID=143950 RepID=A0A2S2PYC0_9HEMI